LEGGLALHQIRWHGRGGQGVVTAAKIFGMSVSLYGNYFAQSFPAFGVERRGSPVLAFTKVASVPILDRSQIYEPDFVVVFDMGLLETIDVTAGLKIGGKILLNSDKVPKKLISVKEYEIFAINTTKIALQIIGKPIMNTSMVGALSAIYENVNFSSVEKAIRNTFPVTLADKNVKAAETAHNQVNKLKGRG